jgi:protein-tyrosine phosphatase
MEPRKLLFLCFGNLCRSPMAEGFFRALYRGDSFAAESAGMGAIEETPPSLLAVLEMKRRGIDISRHRARNIISVYLPSYETVIAMDREVADLFTVGFWDFPDLRVWEIQDPYGGSAGEYRQAAEIIRAHVEEFILGLG